MIFSLPLSFSQFYQKPSFFLETGHVPYFLIAHNLLLAGNQRFNNSKSNPKTKQMVSFSVSQKEEKLTKIEKEELAWPFLPLTSLLKIFETSSYNFPSSLAEPNSLLFLQSEEKQKSKKIMEIGDAAAKDGDGNAMPMPMPMQVETTQEEERQVPTQTSNLLESSVNLNLKPQSFAQKDEKAKDTLVVESSEHSSNAELRTILSHLELILVVHQTLKPLFSPLVNKKKVSFLDLLRTLIKETEAAPMSLSNKPPKQSQSILSQEKEPKKEKKPKMLHEKQNSNDASNLSAKTTLSSPSSPLSRDLKLEKEKKRTRHSRLKRNLFSADFGDQTNEHQNKNNRSKNKKFKNVNVNVLGEK